jgi:hypothetical protein
MQDDSGRQSGWYTVGGALVAAGCALFPLGLATTPRSQTLQFLGLIAFVAGLAFIICAMAGRRTLNPESATPANSQSANQARADDASRPGDLKVPNTPSAAAITKKAPGSPRSLVVTVAASLLVIGVGGFAIFGQGTPHSSTPSPMLSEQHMVGLLIAGDTYARLQQIIGPEPDLQQTFKSGDTLYQFNRPWEFIDLLVRDGSVLSVGVYAKTTAFKATLDADGFSVTINGPTVAHEENYAGALGAVGNCGGNIGASFFEGFGLPMAYGPSDFVLGWVSLRGIYFPQAACSAVFPVNKCDKLDSFSGLSSRFLGCLNSSKIGQEIGELSPSVAVVAAPGQIVLPEMLDYGPLPIGAGLL